MSDTLNALQAANRSSSVLNAIANPPQVNPLAAMSAGVSAAGQVFGLREKQAQQAWGDILQQSTDENGNVDYQKAQKLAAQAGPVVQMGMMSALKDTSGLRGAQITQAGSLYNMIGAASASLMNDPSDANLENIRGSLISSGAPPGALAELDRIKSITDPAARRAEAYKHNLSAMDAQHRLAVGGFPTLSGVNTGGQIEPLGVVQPSPWSPGGMVRGTGTVPTTLTPEGAMGLGIQYPATEEDVKAGRAAAVGAPVFVSGPDVITRFGLGGVLPAGARTVGGGGGGRGGVVDSSGKPVSPANPPRLLNVPGQPPAPAAPAPGYQGTGTGTAADTVPIYQPPAGAPAATPQASQPPGPGGAIVAAVAAAKASGKPVPIPGGGGLVANPDGSVGTPNGGGISGAPPARPPLPANAPRAALDGGVQVASANSLQPVAVGASGPPSPLVPGDVNAIMRGMARGRATPSSGTQTAYNTFSVGPGAEQIAGNKASADKLAADDLAATEWQSTKLPYVEALKNYGEGTKTGPTTDFWNQVAGTIRTPLAKLGINVGPLADTTERVDALGKWLASIQSTNPVSAKSDAELAQVLKGSASTHINEVAGEDMVKAGFTLRRMGAALNNDWHNNPALQTQYGTYLRYLGDMNNKIDPRAFSIDMLNDAQKTRLRTSLQNGSEADAQRFEASLALARRSRQVP